MTIYNVLGWGKGKTTSAIGIAARALANDERVLFCQFLKDGNDKGIDALRIFAEEFSLGSLNHIPQNTKGFTKENCTNFFNYILHLIECYEPNLIILDELNVALDNDLIDWDMKELLDTLKKIGKHHDIYITGRLNNYKIRHQMIGIADIATNCYCEAHNYNFVCSKCDMEYNQNYTYCPCCGTKLKARVQAKVGREC